MQPQDFDSMQKKALQYARDMQQKAGKANYDQTHTVTSESKDSSDYSRKQHSEYTGSYHNNNFGGIKNIFSAGNSHRQNSNSDISLILSLILMLSSDGGDRLLILALLYIMS